MAHEKLKAVINDRGISILQLSMQAGISPSSVYSAINGTIPFYPKWRRKVAKALGISEADIFDDENERG